MNTTHFIRDLDKAVRDFDGPAYKFAQLGGINQSFLRRLLKGERGVSLATAIKLWPLVYGTEFPHVPDPAPSVAQPEPERN